MNFKKIDDRKTDKAKKEKEKWDKKIPRIYKRDESPEQHGEDF